MEAPLHVAASSLLRNLHPDYTARFYFLLPGFSKNAIDCLRRTLSSTGRDYTMNVLENFDTSILRGLRPLHGSYTPYYRLFLPDLVHEERLLYFDSDMRIKIDVSPLFEEEMGSKAMGFVVTGTISKALESKFFLSLGKAPGDPAFNSGTMLFNLPEWHRQECSVRILAFCRKHRTQLATADQTALVALFASDCFHLDVRYNVAVYGTTAPEAIPVTGVLHYLGSPKPWDIGGRLLLPHAAPWFEDLRKTAISPIKRVPWLNRGAWMRLPRILGGYLRVLRSRTKSN